jgi:hypothetical protein
MGHMIGPPALKFRMKKFELLSSVGAGAGLVSGAAGAAAAGDIAVVGAALAAGDIAVAGAVPSAGDMAGEVVVSSVAATEAPGAAASVPVERAGEVAGALGGLIAGLVAGGAAGLCAKLVSAAVMEQRLTISVFFILAGGWSTDDSGDFLISFVYFRGNVCTSSKSFGNFSQGRFVPMSFTYSDSLCSGDVEEARPTNQGKLFFIFS